MSSPRTKLNIKALRASFAGFSLLYMLAIGTWLAISDHVVTDTAKHFLGLLLAISGAYQVWLWPGAIGLKVKNGHFKLKASGSLAIFCLVLWWWEGPNSPVVSAELIIRNEVRTFATDLQQLLIKYANDALTVSEDPQKFQAAINDAVELAKREIADFCANRDLTGAEQRLLDKLQSDLPKVMRSQVSEPVRQQDSRPSESTNVNTLSGFAPTVLSNVPGHGADLATNSSAAASSVPLQRNTNLSFVPKNVAPDDNVSSAPAAPELILPQNLETSENKVDLSPLPTAISNALAANWTVWTNEYPYGFALQYRMQPFGPFNVPNDLPFRFDYSGPPQMTYTPGMQMPVFVPVVIYRGLRFSKPKHFRPFALQDTLGVKRPWHILPVATYIQSVDPNLVIIGNAPDSNWHPQLWQFIDSHQSDIARHFPHGCYMITSDYRELNVFQGLDPNNRNTSMSEAEVSSQPGGWRIVLPPPATNGREVEVINLESLNLFKSVAVKGTYETNTYGAIGFDFYGQPGPVFFLGVANE